MLTVNSNSLAYGIARNLNETSSKLQETANRISTGKRILTAKDDPAGIGILSTMKSHYASYNAVNKNLSAGQSLLDTATTSLMNQQTILNKMKDTATQAASDLLSADQRTALQSTFAELQKQLDDTVNKATIFGQNLTGAAAADVDIQSGINAGDTTTISAVRSDGVTLGVDAATVDLTDSTSASAAMTAIDAAIGTVSTNLATLGAQSNGIESVMATTKSVQGNLEKSMSSIEDIDVAEESSKLALLQTKQQLGIAMLQIVNNLPASALSLLR